MVASVTVFEALGEWQQEHGVKYIFKTQATMFSKPED